MGEGFLDILRKRKGLRTMVEKEGERKD